ncbi:MAG: class I SAM-dependent RNA methyltransferase [Rhizobiaceae bacterium]|nr:class I SAM-dependent RNA methyltransferase [Rhizobiaceae bacterium]
MSARLTIDHLGAQGDGVARTDDGPVYVPHTLPGEVVNAAQRGNRADLIAVLEPSPLRVEPPCRHFGACGGCALQHMASVAYNGWKRDLAVHALRSRGVDTPVADVVRCAPHTRRRAVFAARKTERGLLLGYHAAMSHTVVPVEECPILLPAVVGRLDDIRNLAALFEPTKQTLRLAVTASESGLDIHIAGAKLNEKLRIAISRFAGEAGFARVSVGGEIVLEPRKPVVSFGGVPVELPPGGFLQATAEAESTMAELVTGHLAGAKRIADLFSGAGTFALRLANKSEVHAAESDAASLAALDRAARHASGLRKVTSERRDLDRRPLTAKELSRFDGLVFDPPRAGAEEQAKQIGRSDIPRVAAVSCNPVTLARDLSILIKGGYRLVSVTPIDQFLWSPHVEAVALLEKPKRRR